MKQIINKRTFLTLSLLLVFVGGCTSTNVVEKIKLEPWEINQAEREIINYKSPDYQLNENQWAVLFDKAILSILPSAIWFCNEYAINKEKCLNFKFYYYDDDSFNAFASENDGEYQVIIHTGVFKKIATLEETAFLLAHELAHHIHNHIQYSKRNENVGDFLGGMLGIVIAAALMDGSAANKASVQRGLDLGNSVGSSIGSAIGGQYAFSSMQELEADFTALFILQNAWLDLNIAKDAILKTTNKIDLSERFLQTHPSGPRRLASFNYNLRRAKAAHKEVHQNTTCPIAYKNNLQHCLNSFTNYDKAIIETSYFLDRRKQFEGEGFKAFYQLQ